VNFEQRVVAYAVRSVLRLIVQGTAWVKSRSNVCATILKASWACVGLSCIAGVLWRVEWHPPDQALAAVGVALFLCSFLGNILMTLSMRRRRILICAWRVISRCTIAGATCGIAAAATARSNLPVIITVLVSAIALAAVMRVAVSESETFLTSCLALSKEEKAGIEYAGVIAIGAADALPVVAGATAGVVVGIGWNGLPGDVTLLLVLLILIMGLPLTVAAGIAFEWNLRGRPMWSSTSVASEFRIGFAEAFITAFSYPLPQWSKGGPPADEEAPVRQLQFQVGPPRIPTSAERKAAEARELRDVSKEVAEVFLEELRSNWKGTPYHKGIHPQQLSLELWPKPQRASRTSRESAQSVPSSVGPKSDL
jgi:hypothetical protein